MVDRDLQEEAYSLWNSFKEEILFKNRYIINHEVLEYLRHFAEKNQTIINEETILYRARIYNEDSYFLNYLYNGVNDANLSEIEKLKVISYMQEISKKRELGFWGFDSKDSFVPPSNDNINDGRANPSFIKYLYTAENPYTALVEVRPFLNSKVSVTEIKVNNSLRVADFSFASFINFEGFERHLIYFIMSDFSMPSNGDKKDYIPTQYIAEYIKT